MRCVRIERRVSTVESGIGVLFGEVIGKTLASGVCLVGLKRYVICLDNISVSEE